MTDYSGQGQVVNQPAGFNANNRIADAGWQYDARGNVIKQASGETFAYDAENRVVAYCPNDGNPVNCTQTAGNNRTLYYMTAKGIGCRAADRMGRRHLCMMRRTGSCRAAGR